MSEPGAVLSITQNLSEDFVVTLELNGIPLDIMIVADFWHQKDLWLCELLRILPKGSLLRLGLGCYQQCTKRDRKCGRIYTDCRDCHEPDEIIPALADLVQAAHECGVEIVRGD